MKDEQSNIAWHPAFVEAIKLELDDYGEDLEFHVEFQLTAEPLKIDCVIIKKVKSLVIEKNIAAIFRDVNLLEYKSPDDYISTNDFYKVYGYACLYASLEKVSVSEMTLTFIGSHYPRELLKHLKKIRGYTVEEKSPGIYTVVGDILPIQIIDNRRLSAEENLWLRELNFLDLAEMRRILTEINRLGKAARITAYLDVIARANEEILPEVLKMSDGTLSLQQIFEKAGFAAAWEAKGEVRGEARGEVRGEERKAMDIAQNMVNLGYSVDDITAVTLLDPEKVKSIMAMGAF